MSHHGDVLRDPGIIMLIIHWGWPRAFHALALVGTIVGPFDDIETLATSVALSSSFIVVRFTTTDDSSPPWPCDGL